MNGDEMMEKLNYIRGNATVASRYEQLAEESIELAHAAQKLARYLRDEQPLADDFDPEKEAEHLLEEFTDVNLAWHALHGLPYAEGTIYERMDDMYEVKLARWAKRIEERLMKRDRQDNCR